MHWFWSPPQKQHDVGLMRELARHHLQYVHEWWLFRVASSNDPFYSSILQLTAHQHSPCTAPHGGHLLCSMKGKKTGSDISAVLKARQWMILKSLGLQSWRDGSVVENAYRSCRGPGLFPIPILGGLQLSETTVIRDLMPSAICRLWAGICMHIVHINSCRHTYIYIFKIFNLGSQTPFQRGSYGRHDFGFP